MVLYGPVQDQDALGSLLDRILSQASTPVTVVSLPGRRVGLEMEGRDESHRHLVASCWPLPCEEEASLLSEGCERIDLHRCLHRLPCWWRVPGRTTEHGRNERATPPTAQGRLGCSLLRSRRNTIAGEGVLLRPIPILSG